MNNPFVIDALNNIEQGAPAWDRIRLGLFTGSGISDLMTDPKTIKAKEAGELSATAHKYVVSKVMEVATGLSQSDAYGRAIEWGLEYEEQGLLAVLERIECPQDKAQLKPSFRLYNQYSGASADGLCYYPLYDLEVGIELKCPYNSANHYYHSQVRCNEDLLRVNADYYWQIQLNMLAYNKSAWIFASYDPRQKPNRQLHTVTILADIDGMKDMCQRMERANELKIQMLKEWNTL